MSNKRSILLVFAILVIGAVIVAAQDDDNTNPWSGDWHGNMMQGKWGHGGMGMMFGGFDHENTMHAAIAEALGLDDDAFYAAMSDGKTLAEIAEEQGVELSVISGVMISQAAQHMGEMVEAGYMTQDEMNERLAYMSENTLDHLNGDSGCLDGTGMGMRGFSMHWDNENNSTQWGHRGRGHMGGMWGGRWK